MLVPYLVLPVILIESKSPFSNIYLIFSSCFSFVRDLINRLSRSLYELRLFLIEKIPILAIFLTSMAPSFKRPATV